MMLRIIALSIWCGMILWMSSCSEKKISREEIVSFIESYEKKAAFLDRRLSEERWEYCLLGKSDSLGIYEQAYASWHADSAFMAKVREYISLVNDPGSRRKLALIARRCPGLVAEADPQVCAMNDSLTALIRTRQVAGDSTLLSPEQLLSTALSEKDRDRRRDTYMAYSLAGDGIVDGLAALARARNAAVARLGLGSYYDVSLVSNDLDSTECARLFDALDKQSAEPYKTALDSIRQASHIDDLQVWDVFYILNQSESKAAQYTPAAKQMALAERTLAGFGIALAKLPIYFAVDSASGNVFCNPVIAVRVPSDIRVPVRLGPGLPSLRRLLGQAGEAVYLTRINNPNFLFSSPAVPCFEAAMGSMISQLTWLDSWQRKYPGLPDPMVVELKIRRDFARMFELRLALVELAFEKALYRDPSADLRRMYADLFEHYMLMPAVPGCVPWEVVKRCVVEPINGPNLVVGDCIAAQLYHYLILKYSSVLDNPQVYDFLTQNLLRFGSLDDWDNLIVRSTGEALNPRYFISFPGN